MKWMIRLYPRRWRERYGLEFEALLEECPPRPKLVVDVVRGALDARLHLRSVVKEPDMPSSAPRWIPLVVGLLSFVILLIPLNVAINALFFWSTAALHAPTMASTGRMQILDQPWVPLVSSLTTLALALLLAVAAAFGTRRLAGRSTLTG